MNFLYRIKKNFTFKHFALYMALRQVASDKAELHPLLLTNGTNQAPFPIRLKREKRERNIRVMNGFITTLCPVPTAVRFCINTFARGNYFCWFFDVRSAPCLRGVTLSTVTFTAASDSPKPLLLSHRLPFWLRNPSNPSCRPFRLFIFYLSRFPSQRK